MNKNIVQDFLIYLNKHRWLQILLISLATLIVALGFILATFDYFVHTPKQRATTEQGFVVNNGEGLRAISTSLKNKKIISSDLMFMIYLKVSGLSGNIQAGEYSLSPSMTPITIADILSNGKVASRRITIPEGWTISQMGEYLEKQGIVKKVDFEVATHKQYPYDFLAGKASDITLEGFLFPDTYQVSVMATADSIVKMMLENFDRRITTDLRATADKSGLGLYKTIVLASIVEEEANKPADRKVVAGIFMARLNEGMRLQSDVTVAYPLGEDRKEITAQDLATSTPYNTYLIDGLPVGPICNPGLDSITSVIYPEMTSFRYFIAAEGQMYYAKTLDEHNALVAKYLR